MTADFSGPNLNIAETIEPPPAEMQKFATKFPLNDHIGSGIKCYDY
jgi:hypothetical protein